ncbi:MAG TPA: 4'-phosphopantetheinyl transferase superfamily protein [Chitinophagaceae bacterium]|nr:4'-phosphopantetheinyl transferase superfamily protein [Chitinophagaceae bacterium]
MPIFFQHQINETTRLGIWKIEENEDFFKNNVPLHRDVTHPHKRLQHLAGRFLLQFLFPDFPYELIRIADTRKPFLPGEQYHFSISHCGDYAAAIVSKNSRVGIDIEIPVDKIARIKDKFLNDDEQEKWANVIATATASEPNQEAGSRKQDNEQSVNPDKNVLLTLLWSSKESVFKWYGDGKVDFREHILLIGQHDAQETIDCFFTKNQSNLSIQYRKLDHLVLAWVVS